MDKEHSRAGPNKARTEIKQNLNDHYYQAEKPDNNKSALLKVF